jgi:hypothetical protein
MTAMAVAREPESSPGWLLDELASAGRENLDATHVARCDAKEDAGAAGEVALLADLGLTQQAGYEIERAEHTDDGIFATYVLRAV